MGTPGVPIKTKDILEAIKKGCGRVTRAAKHLGCAPSTIWARAQQEPEIQDAIDKARKDYDTELIDEACDGLLDLVKNKEASAIFFTLKTKGKHLGFEQEEKTQYIPIPFSDKGSMEKPKEEKDGGDADK